MRVFHFTEQAYPEAWDKHQGSLRVVLPNRILDPKIAAERLHRYYDEWQLADELGYDIMVNEHHSTATCMASTVIVTLSVLARETKRARLLVLGYPIAHRPDPLRCAEELSTIDVVSRGRLEMGFVKGVPYEIPVANTNPVFIMERFWEAHDFIIKAMTSHEGPFNWEGQFFHYRHVNIWPRPYQQPHPPVWSTTSSRTNARVLGQKGYVMATLGSGYATRALYDAYREGWHAAGRKEPPPPDRFAYLALVGIAPTEEEARRRGELVAGYPRTSAIVAPQFRNPPGSISAEDNARLLQGRTPPRSFTKDGRVVNMATASVQELIDAAVMFCGTPDQVYRQIADFTEHCGGLGNLLMMGQAGHLGHDDTVASLKLFASEVMPRLKELKQPTAAAAAAE
ncbi:MAG TPA: LLM class flavin-dependent oxidoreductase [Stellaceae bacterium]|nr:LLM class flavin-dependent oxidoreductase [Stellaceae bacterium]